MLPVIILPKSQNEIINVIGCDIILAGTVAKIKRAKFFSVLADEVSFHNTEHLPICIRYIDDDNNTWEDFVSFVRLERVRASDIAEAIIKCLNDLGLS